MKKIGIICKSGRPEPLEILKDLLPWLGKKGLETFLDIETAQSSVLPQRITAFIDDLLIILGYRRKETKSTSLGNATTAVERIIERKIKSVNLLFRTGMFQ